MSKKKVLLVDDVNLIIELEKAFLKGLPVDVLVARNGAEGLEIARSEHPDLIYLDLNMPVMDGPTCCKALKADPVTRHIPVIMVTTAGRKEDELLCQAAGCDQFLTKPINGKLFLEKGRAALAGFERRRRRFHCVTDVEFLKDGQPRFGVTADISRGGLFIAIPHDGIPDEPVVLSFVLPIGGDTVPVAATARVAWKNSADSLLKPSYPAGIGVEFTDIEPELVVMIESFLDEQLLKQD